MSKFLNKLLFLNIFISLSLFGQEFSAMTLNVNNLFDTLDDASKDDKAYLPIEAKQSSKHKKSCNRITVKSWKNECLYLDWDKETKNAIRTLFKLFGNISQNNQELEIPLKFSNKKIFIGIIPIANSPKINLY